jgi:hypothetical protein
MLREGSFVAGALMMQILLGLNTVKSAASRLLKLLYLTVTEMLDLIFLHRWWLGLVY